MKSPFLTVILFTLFFTVCDKSDGPAPIGQIFGKVVEDSTQTPVINIPVNLSKNQVSAMTDSLGSFQFDSLQVGSDTITITTAYHDKLKQLIEVAEGPQEMTFQLNYNRGQIKGVVKDDALNNPIEGAVIYLSINQVSDTTDSLGQFLLDSLYIGTDTLVINASYYDLLLIPLNINEGINENSYLMKINSEFGCVPVEDTSKVYIYGSNEIPIYNKSVWARFSKEITDTLEILPLLQKYKLKANNFKKEPISNQWTATLCIMDNALPQCHFTPWGNLNIENFGSSELVDYCFAVVNEGYTVFNGIIYFQFSEGTTNEQIESMYAENGLIAFYQSSSLYYAFITRKSKKNPFDLWISMKGKYSFLELIALVGPSGGLPSGNKPRYRCN